MNDAERTRTTAEVLRLLDESVAAHERGDDAAVGRAIEQALAVDALCVSVIRGGMLIGEVPDPDRDPDGWAAYVQAARRRVRQGRRVITAGKRLIARAFYGLGPVCFACGRRGDRPCSGHEYGGTIGAYRLRRWAPWWLARYVDPRQSRGFRW
jgi:hypothetical protein